ncbi:REP element-mobilizing transposase RayT [Rubritalea squalenifaciens DSM 18772]|uniref:REP element-mobilizing transposase RayT n=1 Tax=Rubritalea squalenifaciens DSM 18772 TaxID=1123071 RepID=A0A1M6BJ27_9BACT|nr:IS200/IS605 family transposase [Rubritalea squalenifaciens]SHI48588.1 REP element-mobilizing transposase RayT [Rubritalea squalenifaciens DSM 18772]
MSSTHACIYLHVVFGTKDRIPWISAEHLTRLHSYIGGCLSAAGSKALAVGGISDHVHILLRIDTTQDVAGLMRSVKRESSRWMKEQTADGLFAWQPGYAVFSVSPSGVEEVRRYILKQEEHHKIRSFEDEFQIMLQKAGLEAERTQ